MILRNKSAGIVSRVQELCRECRDCVQGGSGRFRGAFEAEEVIRTCFKIRRRGGDKESVGTENRKKKKERQASETMD